jgi:hypothetical protein
MAATGKTYRAYLPPYSTVYWHVHSVARSWSDRTIDASLTRASAGTGQKKAKWTTLIIIDSQAVQNTCNASVESKGFCFYKATNGIKRHLAVDTLGFPFFTHCTSAKVSDDAGRPFDGDAKPGLFSVETDEHS